MLSGEYPPEGVEWAHVFHLAGAFVKLGHRVTVITVVTKALSEIRKNPSAKGCSVLSVKWAPLPMAFTVSYGKWAS
ncbi:MAG: hypothetical protein Ct9H90mP16_07570 [Candidatus Poseidoniales archaeon]|nr:MAG: hypothetical protein Ct9H90mP16_07570 [Candidatus Poseidoniales archaeon]